MSGARTLSRYISGALAAVVVASGGALVSTVPAAAAGSQLAASSAMPTWQVNGQVNAIVYSGSTVFVAGKFTQISGPAGSGEVRDRQNLAAFNASTGTPLDWAPVADAEVRALAVSPDGATLYLGGHFRAVNGEPRRHAASVSTVTGAVTPWRPVLSAAVRAVAVSPDGKRVYVGGPFKVANGQSRLRLAAYSTETGALDAQFAPNPDGSATQDKGVLAPPTVNTLATTDDGTLYIGGVFTTISGVKRSNGAAVDGVSGVARPFAPSLTHVVLASAVTPDGSAAVFGGRGPGGFIAEFAGSTGARVWNSRLNGDVQAMTIDRDVVYLGGHFTSAIDPTSGTTLTRRRLAAIDLGQGAYLPWAPRANSALGVFALADAPGFLAAGGAFTLINGKAQQGFAQFQVPTT